MKITLVPRDVFFAKDLTYKEACEAMTKTNGTPMAEHYRFLVWSQPSGLWILAGEPLMAAKTFINNPDACTIEIETKKEE